MTYTYVRLSLAQKLIFLLTLKNTTYWFSFHVHFAMTDARHSILKTMGKKINTQFKRYENKIKKEKTVNTNLIIKFVFKIQHLPIK